MRLTIDTEARVLTEETPEGPRELPLYSPEAFSLLNRHWVRVGWSQKYSYGFTWLGRPVIQLPEDLVRIQELIYRVEPDVIVETGVAHGGSLIFYASLCKALDRGRVIGVDIEIRPHNRVAIEAHPLSSFITLIEGARPPPRSSRACKDQIGADERVLVILDSNHTKAHVLAELAAYGPLVSPGSYIVAADGIMADLADCPGRQAGVGVGQPQRGDHRVCKRRSAVRARGARRSVQRGPDRGARHVLALGLPQAASRRVNARRARLRDARPEMAGLRGPGSIISSREPTSSQGPEVSRRASTAVSRHWRTPHRLRGRGGARHR